MAAYATPAELAAALNTKVTAENTELLQSCLDAAAEEIDAQLDLLDGGPVTDPVPDIVRRTNINRAVEWYKAPDAYNGGVGTVEVGALEQPTSGFERHAATILPLKEQWGIG